MLLPLLLATAAVVRTGGTALRSGCSADAETLIALPAGQPVEIRFALSGDTSCYKVLATVEGRTLAGYVFAGELVNLEEFDRARRAGHAVEVNRLETRAVTAAAASGNPEIRGALDAIRQNEPARALGVLEPLVRSRPEPDLLALAGIAAWKSDEIRIALEYWKRSLDLRPNPELERLYRAVEKESAGDRSTSRMYGLRVLLRYEPATVSEDLARSMVLALDTELERVSAELGCAPKERLVAVVQSREAYLATTGSAEWSGGRYDGRIRVALVEDAFVGPRTRRVFAHEMVHACLANLGRWPPWLHEGLAQKLSGDRLSPAARARLKGMIEARKFPKLEQLGRNLAAMNAGDAQSVYALALLAVERLLELHGQMGLRNMLANPHLLAQLTNELDRDLGL